MSRNDQSFSPEPQPPSAAERLDSWKEIAAYLKRSVRTVRRWETEQNLPVHRHLHQTSGTVYAFKSELDGWWSSRAAALEEAEDRQLAPVAKPKATGGRFRVTRLIGFALVSGVVLLAFLGVRWLRHTSSFTPHRVMLAVLPLDDLSPEPGQDYFSDGLTEEITTELGRLSPKNLGVIARTSVSAYKKTQKRVDQIGQELGVNYVLEGSVRKQAEQVRVAVQLIRVSDQTHIWAASYDKNSRDTLRLQSEIAHAVGREIEITLAEGEAHVGSTSSANQEAHEAFLMGRYFWNKKTPDALTKAVHYFEQATRLDPNYAGAYSALADCYAVLPAYSDMTDLEAAPKIEAAANRALQIDAQLGEAYASLGVASMNRWAWDDADAHFQRAIELAPNHAPAHQWYAAFLQEMGRLDEAAVELNRARELDPLSPTTSRSLAYQLYAEHRYDASLAQLKLALEMDTHLPLFLQNHLGFVYLSQGLPDRAVAELRKVPAEYPGAPERTALLGYALAVSGKTDEARRALRDLRTAAGKRPVSFYLAVIYFGLGEKDLGFELLNTAIDEHDGSVPWIKSNPLYDNLRSDPRYTLLLKRMNLPLD